MIEFIRFKNLFLRARSSAGRATLLQSEGQRFESARVHQIKQKSPIGDFNLKKRKRIRTTSASIFQRLVVLKYKTRLKLRV